MTCGHLFSPNVLRLLGEGVGGTVWYSSETDLHVGGEKLAFTIANQCHF